MERDDSPEVAALFALPPEQFVAARDELAKRLRAEGDREGAKQVRQLRRPTVPAWAVDQLARGHPDELDELLEAGARLRQAQQQALSGQGAAGLREATAHRRDVIDRLTDHAAAALTETSRDPAPHRAEIAATLEAASVDEQAAAAVRAGTLSHELTPPSTFGDLSAWTAPAAPADRPEPEPQPQPEPEPDDETAARRAELTEALHQAQARADQAAQAARDADQAAQTARQDSAAAAQEVEGLEHLLAGARSRAQAAERRGQEAGTAADRARQDAQQATDRLQQTQQLLQELEKR